LFPGNFPGLPTVSSNPSTTSYNNPPFIDPDWADLVAYDPNAANIKHLPLPTIALDATYDKIIAGSWVLIDRPDIDFPDNPELIGRVQTFHRVTAVASVAMTTHDGGFSTKVTQLTLDPPWLGDILQNPNRNAKDNQSVLDNTITEGPGLLSGTVVYAQV